MEYIVIENKGLESEAIWYAGESEIEAYKKYKSLKGKNRSLNKAIVRRTMVQGVSFISCYDIKEVIK